MAKQPRPRKKPKPSHDGTPATAVSFGVDDGMDLQGEERLLDEHISILKHVQSASCEATHKSLFPGAASAIYVETFCGKGILGDDVSGLSMDMDMYSFDAASNDESEGHCSDIEGQGKECVESSYTLGPDADAGKSANSKWDAGNDEPILSRLLGIDSVQKASHLVLLCLFNNDTECTTMQYDQLLEAILLLDPKSEQHRQALFYICCGLCCSVAVTLHSFMPAFVGEPLPYRSQLLFRFLQHVYSAQEFSLQKQRNSGSDEAVDNSTICQDSMTAVVDVPEDVKDCINAMYEFHDESLFSVQKIDVQRSFPQSRNLDTFGNIACITPRQLKGFLNALFLTRNVFSISCGKLSSEPCDLEGWHWQHDLTSLPDESASSLLPFVQACGSVLGWAGCQLQTFVANLSMLGDEVDEVISDSFPDAGHPFSRGRQVALQAQDAFQPFTTSTDMNRSLASIRGSGQGSCRTPSSATSPPAIDPIVVDSDAHPLTMATMESIAVEVKRLLHCIIDWSDRVYNHDRISNSATCAPLITMVRHSVLFSLIDIPEYYWSKSLFKLCGFGGIQWVRSSMMSFHLSFEVAAASLVALSQAVFSRHASLERQGNGDAGQGRLHTQTLMNVAIGAENVRHLSMPSAADDSSFTDCFEEAVTSSIRALQSGNLHVNSLQVTVVFVCFVRAMEAAAHSPMYSSSTVAELANLAYIFLLHCRFSILQSVKQAQNSIVLIWSAAHIKQQGMNQQVFEALQRLEKLLEDVTE